MSAAGLPPRGGTWRFWRCPAEARGRADRGAAVAVLGLVLSLAARRIRR